MADKCNCSSGAIKDKVCIHTDKVYDSCRELHYTTYQKNEPLENSGFVEFCK